MSRRQPGMHNLWLAPGWLALVACLPWWLGLPLLLSLATLALLLQRQLDSANMRFIRAGLRWGLAGLLIAIVRVLGGDVFAWVVALVAALAGFTVLAGLEAWLDRKQRRTPEPLQSAEWPELAKSPVGPAATLVELQPPLWTSAAELADPRGARVAFVHGRFQFADGGCVDDVDPTAGFSADGRWFFARIPAHGGIVLWDRDNDRQWRLPNWDLCGWHAGQPWLIRGDGAPQVLSDAFRLRRR